MVNYNDLGPEQQHNVELSLLTQGLHSKMIDSVKEAGRCAICLSMKGCSCTLHNETKQQEDD